MKFPPLNTAHAQVAFHTSQRSLYQKCRQIVNILVTITFGQGNDGESDRY